jgi:predicted ATPase/class 3 adenylate cyclase
VTGIRALLLTDVVDSTDLASELGDVRMAELWVAHDRLVRDLLPAWRGVEADRTDGFLLLFDEVADAVGFASAFHEGMAALSARFGVMFAARVGLHWGPIILLETSAADRARGAKPLEVEGLAKPFAARVMSLAVGGQTLLSGAAREELGRNAAVVSHGFWRMKGVREAVEIFELAGPSAPLSPPVDTAKVHRVVRSGDVWLPVREVKRSLPAERDVFVGREDHLHDLAELVDEARLVTVLGPGGTGKTRLVTRFAWTWLGEWPGGAWFCDLSDARTVDDIVSAVARTLDVSLGQGDPLLQLGHAIAGRGRCLVLFDNFEQVASLAEATLGRWLDQAEQARFVVTSQVVLGLRGECVMHLPTLDEPEAIELFVTRAVQTKRDFVLAEADRPAVALLVRMLDGLPLAIELAAARARLMPPRVLLQRMSERFKLLSAAGSRSDRRSTLRATLDWSWNLLSADEQAALAQLSVFEGGFTLEAAEDVLSLSATSPTDAVQALLDKSLVRRASDARFDLLMSVREYAGERLDGAARAEAESRHGRRFAAWGTPEALVDLEGTPERWRALAADLDNVLIAVRRAVARGDAEVAVLATRAAWAVLARRGPFAAGEDLARQILAMPLQARERALVELVLGSALDLMGRRADSQRHGESALAIARELGDAHVEAMATVGLGLLEWGLGRTGAARARFEAALALGRASGDRLLECAVLGYLANLLREQGSLDEAQTCYDQALAVASARGFRRSEGALLGNRGLLSWLRGLPDEARSRFEAALAVARETGDRRLEITWCGNLGLLEMGQRRYSAAEASYRAVLTGAREIGDRRQEGVALSNLAVLHIERGDLDEALPLLDAALRIARESGDRRNEGSRLASLGAVHEARARLDAARECYEAALAMAREVGDRRREGIALGRVGGLAARQGRLAEARACFDEAEPALRGTGEQKELGVLLCERARVELAEGRADAARDALDRAAAIEGGHADLAARIAATRAELGLA